MLVIMPAMPLAKQRLISSLRSLHHSRNEARASRTAFFGIFSPCLWQLASQASRTVLKVTVSCAWCCLVWTRIGRGWFGVSLGSTKKTASAPRLPPLCVKVLPIGSLEVNLLCTGAIICCFRFSLDVAAAAALKPPRSCNQKALLT